MRIAIGADQGGYELKRQISEFLTAQGCQVLDLGIRSLKSVDYPDIAALVSGSEIKVESNPGKV